MERSGLVSSRSDGDGGLGEDEARATAGKMRTRISVSLSVGSRRQGGGRSGYISDERTGFCTTQAMFFQDAALLTSCQLEHDDVHTRGGPSVRGASSFPASLPSTQETVVRAEPPRPSPLAMARLQILQHKSYHPYLESNKQRVRDDEKRQRELDEAEERRVLQAVSSKATLHSLPILPRLACIAKR